MFSGDINLVGGFGTTYDSNYIDKTYAHYDYSDVNPGYFNKGDIETYTITLNPNGGSVNPTSVEVVQGCGVKGLPTPVHSTYQFKGWYTEADGGEKVTSETKPTGDMTIYAQWYSTKSIVYNANGGEFERITFDDSSMEELKRFWIKL